jgi:hypothetical protein
LSAGKASGRHTTFSAPLTLAAAVVSSAVVWTIVLSTALKLGAHIFARPAWQVGTQAVSALVMFFFAARLVSWRWAPRLSPVRAGMATAFAGHGPPVQGRYILQRMSEREKKLTVNEIYFSVQGESTWAGLPCVFVRLTFCDLRCTYCDTEYAFYEGKKRSLGEIVDDVLTYDCPLVEITGGEPLLQRNVLPLMAMLADADRTVLLETSGARHLGG